MKLSATTLEILGNFRSIQDNIYLQKGNVIKTVNNGRSLLAEATIPETIKNDMGIYHLGEFLQAISLVDSPEMEIDEKFATISSASGLSKIKVFFTNPEHLTYPTKSIDIKEWALKFDLSASILKKLKSASSTFSHEIITISCVDNVISLIITNPEDETSSSFSTIVPGSDKDNITGEPFTCEDFTCQAKMDHFTMLPLDYQVSVSSSGIMMFETPKENKDYNIKYWIVLEKD